MAEFITEMQERLLPEYEQMRRFGICTDEEIRDCIRKRDSLFVKITKSQKSVRNYLELIDFEKSVHKLVSEKEAENGQRLAGLKAAIAKRIVRLYREGLAKFSNDTDFWERFIRFSQLSAPLQVAGIYEKMLSYHGGQPQYWADAAIWAYEHARNMPRVENLCERGLQRHPQSDLIYKCLIDILLQEALAMGEDRSEQELGLKKVEIVYANSLKNIEHLEFYLQLLMRLEEPAYKDLTFKLRQQLLNDLREKFAGNEALWNLLAQRELRGLATNESLKSRLIAEDAANISNDETTEVQTSSIEQRIERCVEVYTSAIKVVPTERMWSFYINAMLELNRDMSSLQNLRRKCLANAFKAAHESGLMSIEHYRAFVRMVLQGSNGAQMAQTVLERAVDGRKSVELYKLLIDAYAYDSNEQKVYATLRRANKEHRASSGPVWQRAFEFYAELDTEESRAKLLRLYKEASAEANADFAVFRADYLSYFSKHNKLAKVRKLYKDLQQLPPHILDLHQTMLNIEMEEHEKTNKNLENVRKCYENIAYYFGKTNPDIWLDMINFECKHGDALNVCTIYDRAKATLAPQCVDQFIEDYSTRQIETFVVPRSSM